MNMSFIKVFFSICSGAKIFGVLMDHSLGKAILHFVMLAIVCSSFITFCRFFPYYELASDALSMLSREFDSIEVTDQGIFPLKEPQTPRDFVLTDHFRMCYFPNNDFSLGNIDANKCFKGFIWTPKFSVIWNKVKNGEYLVYPVPVFTASGKEYSRPGNLLFSKVKTEEYIKEHSQHEGTFRIAKESYQFDGPIILPVVMLFVVAIVFAKSFLFDIVLSSFLFTAIFALMYSFVGGDDLKLNFKTLFVISLYAGFPAILVASMFPAFNLPFLDYRTVYVIGFSGYLFVVFNKLKKMLCPEPPEENSNNEF